MDMVRLVRNIMNSDQENTDGIMGEIFGGDHYDEIVVLTDCLCKYEGDINIHKGNIHDDFLIHNLSFISETEYDNFLLNLKSNDIMVFNNKKYEAMVKDKNDKELTLSIFFIEKE